MNEKLTIEQTLDKYGFIIHKVQGTSMLPLLNEDTDLVRLVPVKGKLKKYDLPLYRSPQGTHYILHRILEVKKNYYLICGDNNTFYEKVPFDRVVAVAEGFYKDGKYVTCDDPEYLKYVEKRCEGSVKNREVYKKPIRISAEQRLLLDMLRHAVLDIPYTSKPENINWKLFFVLAQKQEIAAMLYPYVKNTDCPTELLIRWKQVADMALRKEILFDAERKAIFAEFEKEKIKHLPLKGIIIKEFYPHKGMRQFADNDILFDGERRLDVQQIMEARKYEVAFEVAHDVYTRAPFYIYEMHKTLFSPNNPLQKGFSDIWNRAVCDAEGSYAYHMTDEDFYFYIVSHFYKHYSTVGAGLRYFADLFLMRRKLIESHADFDKIKKMLAKAKLDKFNDFAVDLTEGLFAEEYQELPPEKISYILESGMYGTQENYVTNHLKNQSKIHYIFYRLRDRLFLPYKEMSVMYPILKKLPFLLPFCWILRACDKFFTPRNFKKTIRELKIVFHFNKNLFDDD